MFVQDPIGVQHMWRSSNQYSARASMESNKQEIVLAAMHQNLSALNYVIDRQI
jgi:hypothetical protein